MDQLFSEMLQEVGRLGKNWTEHSSALRSADPGQQLGAIAYVFKFPDTSKIGELIDVVENTTQPFVQYWGLRAIQRAVDEGAEYSISDLERLRRVGAIFGSGTDRYLLANSIVRTLDQKRRS
ncbi:hypothetical protein EOA75_15380 [Mesorhizobium sp. M1A.F.Ca.IN.022.07.1.1]|uniref:hypothetical protein n=1 Tax=unclassified Mesorhizobium TaxID=325217 RepID=UPI000FCA0D68|nr:MULTISPECIES: hypothetical protein [unclassified Mesorhizobium]RUV93019.1 hypothetical protein EOA75_15380 [Mesorhizobium sp. M1A.F.Ca.IN.022.07.1.1]RWG08290.1 MAG: hypothetical protein EOQ54_01015 [Mesorhizobium sp.]RWG93706.1 MAG: hypothetical protein EOQ72_29665 [Mesorhizobium sp.]TIN39501.1 MAG: hypothetical protein E5Y25_20460 [Mesorhizobium sp.]TIR89032.1 MAG: hypothetical protein E5X08_29285 [Mesorhizobium sp.]